MPDVNLNLTPTPGMAPVETVTTPNLISSGSSGVVQTPAAAAADRRVLNEAQGVAQAQDAVTEAIPGTTEGKVGEATLLSSEKAGEAEERDKFAHDRQPIIDAARDEMHAAQQKYQDHKFYDYWDSLSTGNRIVARLAMFLGGVGAGPSGRNTAMENINRDIERDFERQKIALHSKEQAAEWKKQGYTDLYDQLQKGLAELTVKQGLAYESVAEKSKAMALRAGTPEAIAKAEVVARESALAAAKLKQDAQRHIERRVETPALVGSTQTTSAGKGAQPTESQNKDAFLGKNLGDAMDIIEGIPALSNDALKKAQDQELQKAAADQVGKGWTGALGAKGASLARDFGLTPRSTTSGMKPDEQKAIHAYTIAKEMVARKLSGGAIVTDEDRQNAEKYMEHADDSPQLRAQKRQVLRNMAKEMMALSGQAGPTASGSTAAGELADATRWLAANPKDPRAAGVRAKMQRKYGANAVRP